jgi:hypothetical protein
MHQYTALNTMQAHIPSGLRTSCLLLLRMLRMLRMLLLL